MFPPMPTFRRLDDLELSRLGDEDLVAYIRRARAAGDLDAMRIAIQVFCLGLHDLIRGRVRMKMQRASDADVDAVTASVLEGAMMAEFSGESVGELRALVTTIVRRRVADYHRSARGDARVGPLVDEHPDDESVRSEPARAAEELSGVWARDLIERSLDGLSPAHRETVLRRIEGYSAKQAAELVNDRFGPELATPMTDQNVDQIYSRFRRRLRDLIEEADRVGGESESESDV